MNKKIIIVILLVILLVLAFNFLRKTPGEVTITTDQTEYESGEAPTMTIENSLSSNICFSSCYPYYLEKNNGQWKSYPYAECEELDLVEKCIESDQAKGFELVVSLIETGLHRIAVPSCVDCQIGEKFEENRRFYSNEFTIK
jgi:hypothetical protein